MSDRIGAIWRDQPEERLAVNLDKIVNRRTEELYSSTRSDILMSIGAALLFVAVIGWRLAPAYDPLLQIGFGAAAAWVAIAIYRFRRRIWRPGDRPADAAAATGLDYYRRELEQRRDHLKREWLWHGPLFLACVILIAILTGNTFSGYRRVQSVLPLVLMLAVWTGFSLVRRFGKAREIQREIDEI